VDGHPIADGEVVKTGATPLTFVGTSGAEYPVTVSNCESWVAAIAELVAILDRSLSGRTRYLSGSRRIAVRSSPRGGALRFLGYYKRSGGFVAPFVPILGFGARPSERRLLSGFFFRERLAGNNRERLVWNSFYNHGVLGAGSSSIDSFVRN
jgi:hypothetical protein